MLGDVEVQDASTAVADDEEAIEHAKVDRWHREEVHGRNRFPVVSKEGEPAFSWLGISRTGQSFGASLASPGTKACDAVGGTFRLEWREGPVRPGSPGPGPSGPLAFLRGGALIAQLV